MAETGSQPPPRAGFYDEGHFLSGPLPRGSDTLRMVRIMRDIARGLRVLHHVGPCVTVFGSSRTPEDHPRYAMAVEVGYHLAKVGFTVMTGGGPGIMEAASRGARQAGGRAVGLNIELPQEQIVNRYVDTAVEFRYFFVRKLMLVKYSCAFVVLPGGFGTMDEVFETATLIQTGKIREFPIVLMDGAYWQPLFAFMRQSMVPAGAVAESELALFTQAETADAVVSEILARVSGSLGLRWARTPGAKLLLAEADRRRQR